MSLTPEKFLILHLIDGKSYQDISDTYGIDRSSLSEWWESNSLTRNLIKKSNQLFNNKKGRSDFGEFEKLGREVFYFWYKKQDKVCFYCGTSEDMLRALFEKELSTKRKRGKSLELERRDSTSNQYSPENCVLACYFCNNHKSDIISEEDHIKYFAKPIGQYLEDKYKNK